MGYIVVPKELFCNPLYDTLSADAKRVYGLLNDRLSLSKKNGDKWENADGECFVYFSQAEIMRYYNCGHDKATKLIRELENVGLIRRKRQGLGRPHMLFVNEAFQPAHDQVSEERNSSVAACDKTARNNTDTNKLDNRYPDTSLTNRCAVEALIKEQIFYDVLVEEMDKALLDSIISVIVDTICTTSREIRIAGVQRNRAEVYERFMTLDEMQIRYVYDRVRDEKQVIYSPQGFLLKHLFEAKESMDFYYQSRVIFDERKGEMYL